MFSLSTHALNLTGTITDKISGKPLEVEITLTGADDEFSNEKGKYEILEFDSAGSGAMLTFKLAGYEDFVAEFVGEHGVVSGVKVKKDGKWIGSEPFEYNPDEPNVLKLDIKMMPLPQTIITGKVVDSFGDPIPRVKLEATSKDFITYSHHTFTNSDGTYSVDGYLAPSDDKPFRYRLNFIHSDYKAIDPEMVEVGASVKEAGKQVLSFLSVRGAREKQMEAMSGFECSEIMPKHLIGANCSSHNDLKGDADDLAMWIQKFGSKITTLAGMAAVALIIWNAFTLVTAAGDSDKISQGKKGLFWTVIGLAAIMFAYLIVKTVIVMTYTQ